VCSSFRQHCPQVVIPVSPSVSSSAISESINKTWWGKMGWRGCFFKPTRSSLDALVEASDRSDARDRSRADNMWFHQKNPWSCGGKVHNIQGSRNMTSTNALMMAAGWRLSPFPQWSFMQICCRANAVRPGCDGSASLSRWDESTRCRRFQMESLPGQCFCQRVSNLLKPGIPGIRITHI